jgi:hypothetical protein
LIGPRPDDHFQVIQNQHSTQFKPSRTGENGLVLTIAWPF